MSVSITGRGSIQPATLFDTTAVRQNSDDEFIPDLEAFEGMLVRFSNTLTVSDIFNIERFGEILLSSDGRLMQFTNGQRAIHVRLCRLSA